MKTIVKFYRASAKNPDGLVAVAEQEINASLAANAPPGALVRSVLPTLILLDATYHLIVTVLLDVPDDTPPARLGFRLGGTG